MADIFNSTIKNNLIIKNLTQKKDEETTYRKKSYTYICFRCKKRMMTSYLEFIDWTHPLSGFQKSFPENGETINEILFKFKRKIDLHENECKSRIVKRG